MERTSDGRFAKGNAGGPGNPQAKRVGQLRSALLDAVTPEDVGEIITALVSKAKSGDIASAREILLRTLGRPLESDILERIAALEEAILDGGSSTA